MSSPLSTPWLMIPDLMDPRSRIGAFVDDIMNTTTFMPMTSPSTTPSTSPSTSSSTPPPPIMLPSAIFPFSNSEHVRKNRRGDWKWKKVKDKPHWNLPPRDGKGNLIDDKVKNIDMVEPYSNLLWYESGIGRHIKVTPSDDNIGYVWKSLYFSENAFDIESIVKE